MRASTLTVLGSSSKGMLMGCLYKISTLCMNSQSKLSPPCAFSACKPVVQPIHFIVNAPEEKASPKSGPPALPSAILGSNLPACMLHTTILLP